MLRMLPLLLLLGATSLASAQEETLLGKGVTYGGFGAPVWKLTGLNGDVVAFNGVRGGFIINHTWIIGFGDYGLSGDIAAPSRARQFFTRPNLNMDFSYKGLEFEYVDSWEELFHWGLSALVGGGNINYRDPNDDFHVDDTVFVLEPAVNGTLNITKWFRVAADASYRLVADVDIAGMNSGKASGPALSLELRFGKF